MPNHTYILQYLSVLIPHHINICTYLPLNKLNPYHTNPKTR